MKVTTDKGVYYGKKVISSLPLGVLKAKTVSFVPELPKQFENILQGLGAGTENKIIASF